MSTSLKLTSLGNSNRELEDQKLEKKRKNLAVKNSAKEKNPVSVVRSYKETEGHVPFSQDGTTVEIEPLIHGVTLFAGSYNLS